MAGEFVEAHHDSSFPNATVCLHSHDFYELLYCCNTCGVEYLVGTSRYRLKKGDIVWVAPGMSHRPLIPADTHAAYHRDVIWISRKFMDELVCPFASGDLGRRGRSGLMRTAGTEWEFLGDHFHNCVRESEQKNPGWQMAMMGNVMMLVSGLSRCESKAGLPLPAEAPELLDQVMDYIEAHYSEHITLADTAARFYVSGSTISNLFRQKMGASFYRCGDHFHNCVRESEQKNPGWQMAMMGNVMMLVSGLSRCESKAGLPLPAETPELLDQVMDYIEAHYSEHITLADTAARFYVSGSTISNLFRQKMGASFYRCVTQRRLIAAKDLIRRGTLADTAARFYVSGSTISNLFRQKMGASFYRCVTQRRLIAAKDLIRRGVAMESVNEQVGFKDYSGFYRAFKQEYGLSPRQFRQLQERSAGGWGFSSTISNLFRQKMGASFYRCVTQRRLIAAKDLIRRGVAMESVNEQVGFKDYSGFYRAFKQEYGLSPRQFRQLQERSAGGWGFSHGKRPDTTDG